MMCALITALIPIAVVVFARLKEIQIQRDRESQIEDIN